MLVILAVAIEFSLPFVDAIAEGVGIDAQQERPDELAVDEGIEAALAAVG